MDFRQRLLATLRALRPVYGEGVMIIGSEVPDPQPHRLLVSRFLAALEAEEARAPHSGVP